MKTFSRLAILVSLCLLTACQKEMSAMGIQTPAILNPQTQTFNDTQFDMVSCQITTERSAICKLKVTNRFRDKRIEVDKRITIQDDQGNDYAVSAGGFGDLSGRPQWLQVAVADSTYNLTVIATNLSTKAKSIRAVIFPRLLVRYSQGQTGYRDKVIFSKPAMIASAPPAANTGSSMGSPASAPDTWQVVGYWNYSPADGLHIPTQGLVMRDIPGNGLGQQWQSHLELKNHASLSPGNRSLWPVMINTKQRKVCANYPGYPNYQTFIDMPGESEDGTYQVAECSGK